MNTFHYALAGQPIDRVDGRLKVTGKATYTSDMPAKNLCHAVLLKAEIGHGEIAEIDLSAAKASPGVIDVFDYRSGFKFQLPEGNFMEGTVLSEGFLPMQDAQILYYGQIVGILIAETLEQARDAAARVKMRYAIKTPLTSFEKAPGHAPKQVDGSPPTDSHLPPGVASIADVLGSAEVTVEAHYETPPEHHCTIELHATTAEWQDDHLTVYNPSQWMTGQQLQLSKVLGIPKEKIRVVSPFVGGAFGSKAPIWMHTAIVARAAERLQRPVKLVLTREQTFHSVGYRPATRQQMTLGAKKDGTLIAVRHHAVTSSSVASEFVEPAAHRTSAVLYAAPSIEVSQKVVPLHLGSPCWMRAPGEAPGMFALESAMDELAVALALDPVELRLKNYAETHPVEKRPFSAKHLRECYTLGAEKFGWAKRSPTPSSMQEGEWLIGWGMATAMYPGYRMKSSARVRLLPDGTAVVSAATHELGTGMYTVMTQVTADALGLPLDKVRPELGDSALPEASVAGGSSSVASVLPAVLAAAEAVKNKVFDLALRGSGAPLSGRKSSDLTLSRGLISAGGANEPIGDVLKRAALPYLEASATTEQGKEQEQFAFHSFGAHFIEVRVHSLTREVRVSRVTSVMDVGRILNPKTARSQIAGGVIMGLGMALMEESVVDPRNARWITSDLGLYHFPVNQDIPPIDVHFIDQPDLNFNPLGARGVGEIGITGVAAAVANAVYHATGKRVRDLPITVEKLLT